MPQIGHPKRIYRPTHTFFRIVSASTPLETRSPQCRRRSVDGKVCIRGYKAQQSISAAVSFAATGKLPVRSDRNGARSLVPLNGVYTVLTQARTGPPRRSESNESMEHIGTHLLPAVAARHQLYRCRRLGAVQPDTVAKRHGVYRCRTRLLCQRATASVHQRCVARTVSTYSGIKGPQ
jgi:hypothetical protein